MPSVPFVTLVRLKENFYKNRKEKIKHLPVKIKNLKKKALYSMDDEIIINILYINIDLFIYNIYQIFTKLRQMAVRTRRKDSFAVLQLLCSSICVCMCGCV